METNAISRRNFLRVSSLAGTALCLGFYFPANAKKEELISAHEGDQAGFEFNAWMRIDTDGKVTLTDHRAEMGQGSYQSVPQIIAEELEVDLKDINVIFAIGDPTRTFTGAPIPQKVRRVGPRRFRLPKRGIR